MYRKPKRTTTKRWRKGHKTTSAYSKKTDNRREEKGDCVDKYERVTFGAYTNNG